MKLFSESYKGEKPEGAKVVKSYSFHVQGPVEEDASLDLPTHRGVYFGFKFDKKNPLHFTELFYVGRAIKDNTLNKRVREHYTQKDLKYRETGKAVDMSNVAFQYLDLDNYTDAQISDIEYAFIFKYKPSANTPGVTHYAGDEAPLKITISGFKFADDLDIPKSFLITEKDKEAENDD